MHVAVMKNKPRMVEHLIKLNAMTEHHDINGNSPLMLAVMHYKMDCVLMLLQHGVNVNNGMRQSVDVAVEYVVNEITPIMHAIGKNWPTMVLCLCRYGANVNASPNVLGGQSPLMLAVSCPKLRERSIIITTLLYYGANKNYVHNR